MSRHYRGHITLIIFNRGRLVHYSVKPKFSVNFKNKNNYTNNMRKKYYLVFVIIAVIGTIFISGCIQQEVKENPKIGDIVSNPNLYNGKTVAIGGKFGGWSGNLSCDYGNMTMKTRSDTIIYDETGCLYMTGNFTVLYKEKELDPWNRDNVGGNLTIKAVVSLINGKPILGK